MYTAMLRFCTIPWLGMDREAAFSLILNIKLTNSELIHLATIWHVCTIISLQPLQCTSSLRHLLLYKIECRRVR